MVKSSRLSVSRIEEPSIVFKDNIFNYSVFEDEICYEQDGSCIMITDLKNSTNRWGKQKNHEMAKDIARHNYIIRFLLGKLLCVGEEDNDPYNIWKVNEIGDSWEIIITGPYRHIKMYWLICAMLYYYTTKSSPGVRIGVTDGPPLDQNKTDKISDDTYIRLNETNFMPNKYIIDNNHIKFARTLETKAGAKDEGDPNYDTKSAVAFSYCFINGLLSELNFSERRQKNYKLQRQGSSFKLGELSGYVIEISHINSYLKLCEDILGLPLKKLNIEHDKKFNMDDKITQGYIIFIVFNGIADFSILSEQTPKLVSVEKSGTVINMFSDNKEKVEQLIKNIKKAKNKPSIVTIINSTTHPIYKIQDCPSKINNNMKCNGINKETYIKCDSNNYEDYEKLQTFTRYISHNQNIAARITFNKQTKTGYIYSNQKDLLKNPEEIKFKDLKGIGSYTVYRDAIG